jgi:protocatechuate 3,4-dioxygenase alpha subunit
MRGMLLHAFTRMYFDEHAALHAADPVLALVPKDRLPTLVACKRPGNSPSAVYRFDIHMQGDDETVFFDV